MKQEKLINTLPEGWIFTELGNVSHINMGQSPPSSTYNTKKIGLPFFQGKSGFGEIYPKIEKYCSVPLKTVDAEDVLISVRAPIGPTNLAKTQSCIGRGLAGIKGFGGISSKFILYQLRSTEKELEKFGTGTTFKAISKNILETFPFLLPPLEEQHSIIARIEELFSELDHAEEGLRKAQKQLEVYRQALLKSAFEGKLTEKWREGKEYLSNGLPEGWKWNILGEVSQISMGQSPPGDSYNLNGIGMPLINGPVEFNKSPFSKTKLEKWTTKPTRKCKKGDLLLCVRGSTTGRQNFAGFDACIGRGVAAIHSQNQTTIKYLAYYTHYSERKILGMGTGSTFPNISKEQISNILIPMCTIDEQSQMVQELEQRFTLIENLEKTIDSGLYKLKIVRQTILKMAFEGNLVSQNNENGPVSILLDRIQTEKALYVSSQKLKHKEKPKSVKPMETDKKKIKEILEKSMKPIPSEVLWQESIYFENIEVFYAELKKIEHEIEVIVEGKESSIILKK